MRDFHRRQMALVRSAGATMVRLRHAGTKHPRLIFRLGDVDHVMPVSGTPSDWRAGRKAMAQLRRVLRAT
jgi:hypothetical protein